MQRRDPQTEKEIGSLVGAMCDPIIVWPGYENSLPKNLKDLVPLHRLLQMMKHEETATDVEAAIYFSTVSLDHPIGRDWSEIYLYVAYKALGDVIPKDIRMHEITDYQMGMLRHFKDWLYRTRVRESVRRRHALEAQSRQEDINTQPEPQPQMAFADAFEGFK